MPRVDLNLMSIALELSADQSERRASRIYEAILEGRRPLETALRKLQEAAAGYVHPERRVSAEQLVDLVLAVVDGQDLVRAMRTSEGDSDTVGKALEGGK